MRKLKNIKGAALCYLSLIVVDKCIVVSCTCTGNIDEGLQKDGTKCAGRGTPATMHCKVCIQNDLKCQL